MRNGSKWRLSGNVLIYNSLILSAGAVQATINVGRMRTMTQSPVCPAHAYLWCACFELINVLGNAVQYDAVSSPYLLSHQWNPSVL